MQLVICDNALCSTPCAGYNSCTSPETMLDTGSPECATEQCLKEGMCVSECWTQVLSASPTPAARSGNRCPGDRGAPMPVREGRSACWLVIARCHRRGLLWRSGRPGQRRRLRLARRRRRAPSHRRAGSDRSGRRMPPGSRFRAADCPAGRDRQRRWPHARPAGAREQQVFVSDLFNLFRSYCGACHVDSDQGNFQVTASSFSIGMDRDKVLERDEDRRPDQGHAPAGGRRHRVLETLRPATRCSICWPSSRSGSPRGSRRASSTWLVAAGPEPAGSVEERASYLVSAAARQPAHQPGQLRAQPGPVRDGGRAHGRARRAVRQGDHPAREPGRDRPRQPGQRRRWPSGG